MGTSSVIAILKIMKGIAKVPSDTNSAERGLDEIDFLDPKGFSCDEYELKVPALKSSSVYADSSLSDGRTLISGTVGNVSETIRLQLNAMSMIQLSAMLNKLMRMKQDCNAFWGSFTQIEPVYIKHQLSGEPGPRFALLYEIDIALESPVNNNDTSRIITINIEREPYWRGLAPGENPKKWTIERVMSNQKWSVTTANLLTGGDHVLSETIQNLHELTPDGSWWKALTKNYIDIPASSIPGDAPALLCVSAIPGSTNVTSLMISKSTKYITGNLVRSSIASITNANRFPMPTLNASDGNASTDTTLANDSGACRNATTGTRQRSQTAFVTTTLAERLTWSNNNIGLGLAQMRGRYACFLRCRLSASGTVSVQLNIRQGTTSANTLSLNSVSLTDAGVGGTGSTTDWAVLYLGQISIPISDKRTDVTPAGLGVLVDNGNALDLTFAIYASRDSGTPVFYISDLILMPIDEGALRMVAQSGTSLGDGSNTIATVYDNTGYYKHGDTGEFFGIESQIGVTTQPYGERESPAASGSPIYLTPGINNRLQFFGFVDSSKRSQPTDPSTFSIRVDIVPRWIGMRDV